MTYEESGALMEDRNFRIRIKVGAMKYADYIYLEAATVPGHTSRYRWAQNCFAQPDIVAAQIQPPVVMDPAVQTDGAAIADEALQSAIEGVVNKLA